jgi:peptidoglycan/xylan/chitin deacetylase (PgdA/CDA1 family)
MKALFKYLFYEIICPVLLFFGVDKFLQRRTNHERLIIMYHGVIRQKNFSINGRHLPAAEFEKHLQYYQKNFDVVTLHDICAGKSTSDNKRKVIALTFDDGYLNIIENAVPLLLKYKMPATFFVSTASLKNADYIHPSDYIDLIRKSTTENVTINGINFSHLHNELIHSRMNAYQYINSLTLEEFNRALTNLRSNHPAESITRERDPFLYKIVSERTIGKLFVSELFSIGSHSHDHVNLANLSQDELTNQLQLSKALIEKINPGVVDCLAFPYGYFNEGVIEQALGAGYKYLIAAGSVEPNFSKSVFPRIGVLNMAGYSFNMLSISRGFKKFGF